MNTTRTAHVTGGASRLGAAGAERLRTEGLRVITLDLAGGDVSADVTDEAALLRLAAELGRRVQLRIALDKTARSSRRSSSPLRFTRGSKPHLSRHEHLRSPPHALAPSYISESATT